MTHREFEGWSAYASRLKAATKSGNPEWVRLPQSRRVMQMENGKLFFTGQACENGHISPRNEHGQCTQCALNGHAE